MANALRILVVDDQRRARQSLKALLQTNYQAIDIHEAASGVEAVQSLETAKPDVVIMDVRMPGTDGIEATRLVKARAPQVRVIVLSLYPEYQARALAAGADAFVSKGEPPARLLAALAAAVAPRAGQKTNEAPNPSSD